MPASLAALIAANVAPLVGILVLGWSPIAVLVLYFVDTLLSLGAVLLLVMLHITGNAQGRPISGFKDWAQAVVSFIILGGIFGLPLSLPLWFIGPEHIAAEFERPDSGLAYGVLLQALLSALAAVRMHRELELRDDDDRLLARRALFLIARWITVFLALTFGIVGLLGPRWGAFVLVAIYGGASVYFELFPERAERFVRGANAKPIQYEADLHRRGAATGDHAEAPPAARSSTPSAPPRRGERH
jgi:hypothetical protein